MDYTQKQWDDTIAVLMKDFEKELADEMQIMTVRLKEITRRVSQFLPPKESN